MVGREGRTVTDPRFTISLSLDVARVLEEHGYEHLNGREVTELGIHLFHFLHGTGQCEGGAR